MTEIEILTYLKDNDGTVGYLDLLENGRTGQIHDTLTNVDLIKKLIQDGVLSGTTGAYGNITFGKHGRLRLRDLQQHTADTQKYANNKAKQRRNDYRHDWAVALVSSVIGAILGVVGTLLIQTFF